MTDSSNATPKQHEPKLGGATGKGFVKGDPRINRKGRPRSFDALRQLAQEIAHEIVRTQDGQPALVNGKPITTVELVLRSWAQSKDPRKQQAFIEYAFGKVPTETEISGKDGEPITINVVYGSKTTDGDAA